MSDDCPGCDAPLQKPSFAAGYEINTQEHVDQRLNPNFMDRPLLEDSRSTKRHKGKSEEWPQAQIMGPSNHALHAVCRQLTALVLRQEMELSHLRCQDTFILHLSGDSRGALPLMTKAAAEWKEQMQQGKATMALKTRLTQLFFTELHSRLLNVQKVAQMAPPGNELWTKLLAKELVTQDGDWPYMKWDPQAQQLAPNKEKKALSMKQLTELLTGLVEMVQENEAIQRFAALGASAGKDFTLPSRLQLTLRFDDLIMALHRLSHSSALTLLGATMKSHQAQLSKQAQQLQVMMGKGQGKQKGKGKGEKNPQTP